ncbi:MAG: dihydrolipoyl dehydrogenase [Dehalococcoidia bacterium]|nr:dihydrolipoyl dehydrogenase [Dehalococcoidia bacterium]
MDQYDVVVIGAGPGGYVAAIRAAQLGMKTAIIEKDRVGGLCLNWGCIPSKALIYNAKLVEAMRDREAYGIHAENVRFDLGVAVDRSRGVVDKMVNGVIGLLERNKVTLLAGEATLTAPDRVRIGAGAKAVEIGAKNVIIATGARPRALPGLEVDGKTVIGSREALALKELPRTVAIVGGGAIGMEFAYVYSSYGAQVTVIEALPHLLPNEDEDISVQLERAMKKRGVNALTSARVDSLTRGEGGAELTVTTKSGQQKVRAEKVLVAVGMEGVTTGLGLEKLGVQTDRSYIKTDGRTATDVKGVYAIGDVNGPPLLAHVAQAEGVVAVERIAGMNPHLPPMEDMPRATYCEPQVASIGLTEAQAKERGYDVKVGRFPFAANGKATAENQIDGIVKLVVDAKYDEVLGFHIIGDSATELLAEATMGRVLETTSAALAEAVHAHPTLSEVIKEAALAVRGEAIHFYQGKPGR